MRAKVLFVESTPDVALAIAAMLERHQFEVARADDDRRAAERLKDEHFDVMVVEVRAGPDDGGLRFLRHIHEEQPHLATRIVAISGDAPAVQRELESIGVCDVVLRPVHETEILEAVLECLDRTPAALH